MKLQFIVILLSIVGIAVGLAQLGDEYVSIVVTSEGKAKISQTLFPKTFVSSVDVDIVSENISNLLAIDEKNILLGTTQDEDLLKIATLGASSVNLKYNADILSYESGVFRLKYSSDLESRVSLPPLSKLVSLNTIPIEISEKEYVLPPGDISLSYSIRPVTSKEFFVTVDNSEQKVEAITAAKIEEFSANNKEIQFIIKDKAIVLTIIPKKVMNNPNNVILNGDSVDFSQFHQNSTHSWIRIDPHEKGLVKIFDTDTKTEEGGGCLIATAAYGSELAPQVQMLREIRDNQLLKTDSGISFMNGFNEIYYSFSPLIADYQRENQIFKELVKIGITPMLSSLLIMTNADSEGDVLGLGIAVILINIGMYFVLPIILSYQVMKIVRTRRLQTSNQFVISSKYVRSVLKNSLFGIIALAILSVSVSSAFESAYADEHEDPIKVVLDITYQNILESRDGLDEVPENAETFFVAGEEKYNEALAALEAGDIVTARESAIVAMALFEDAVQEIGAIEEQASRLLPPGFGSAIDSASDTGISTGQGLGVGGIPPGILKQITAANIFEVQEEITNVDQEIEELRTLIESNNLDINLEEYDKSINLAKEVLANGDIPDAQAKLALANEIKDGLFEQINSAVQEKQDERIEQFVQNSINEINKMLEKENLGLTQKAIKELEETLEVLKSGNIDEILEKTDDDSELAKEFKEENKEAEKELSEENKEAEKELSEENKAAEKELRDENKEAEKELAEIDPEAAKDLKEDNRTIEKELSEENKEAEKELRDENKEAEKELRDENKEAEKLLRQFDVSHLLVYSPDDYFEEAFDDQIEDTFEASYDKMNKESKQKEKKDKKEKEKKEKEKKEKKSSKKDKDKDKDKKEKKK